MMLRDLWHTTVRKHTQYLSTNIQRTPPRAKRLSPESGDLKIVEHVAEHETSDRFTMRTTDPRRGPPAPNHPGYDLLQVQASCFSQSASRLVTQ